MQIKIFVVWGFFAMLATSRSGQDRQFVQEMQNCLQDEFLNMWYPAALDSVAGGFFSDFTYDWQLAENAPQNKFLVTQARHVWTASQAALFLQEDRYREIAKHGVEFLRTKMWDVEYGGFYMLRDRTGAHGDNFYRDSKQAYGNAFAIYALASYFTTSRDSSALALARETFTWLEDHSHDSEFGGYFDRLIRAGDWVYKSSNEISENERIRAGWKDQNSSIHLLEAFSALYKAWPDSLVGQRLQEMLELTRDTITTDKGHLTLFLQRDWTPVSFRDSSEAVRQQNHYYDHVSFGHDVETAYLMLEASHTLGLELDMPTLTVAKRMVDHALAGGWDDTLGGFYEAGYYFAGTDTISVVDKRKTWWVQAEGLNALLMMSRLFPEEKNYRAAFEKQWHYINEYLIDHEHGGWYEEGLDQSPDKKQAAKGHIWKGNYHNARALMNCIRMLRNEDELVRLYSKKTH